MQNLLTYIHSLTEFSENDFEILSAGLAKKTFKKEDYLLKEGQVCNSLFFIDSGYCRSYYNQDGIERTLQFYFENEVATNIDSFATGNKSDYFIQACAPVTVIVFDKQKLMQAGKKAPQIEVLGKKCLRATAARMEEHARLFKLYSPLERYEFLEKNQPALLQRVSLTHLASYLGVARETLSRIRKRRL